MTVQHLDELPQNNQPLNRAALPWLQAAKVPVDPRQPFLLQLMWVGFDRGLPIPGPGQEYRWELKQAFERLLAPRFDPLKVVRWLLSNPNGPDDPKEQEDTLTLALEAAESWESAAQCVMECFYDRLSAENDYYQSPASEPSEGSAFE